MENLPLVRPCSKCFTFLYFITLICTTTLGGKCCYYHAFFTDRELRCKEDKNCLRSHGASWWRQKAGFKLRLSGCRTRGFVPLSHNLCHTFPPRWTPTQDNRFGGRWSHTLYNRKPQTQPNTSNKTDLASHQRSHFSAPALPWMPGFISVVGTEKCGEKFRTCSAFVHEASLIGACLSRLR